MRVPSIVLGSIALCLSSPATAKPPAELTDICRDSIEGVNGTGRPDDENYERYVGRLKINIDKAELSADMEKVAYVTCEIYLKGYAQALRWTLKIMDQSKVATRP